MWMWEEGFLGREMCPLRFIGIFEDDKEGFAVFLYIRLWFDIKA